MSDIWSGIGLDIAKAEGEWLFRIGGEIHGPVPQKVVVQKLLRGEIAPNTPVAKEGGDFYPIAQVKIFVPHVQQAKKLAAKRAAAKVRKVLLGVVALVIAGGGVAGYFVYQAHLAAKAKAEQERKAKLAALENQRKKFESDADLALVALVTVNEADIKMGGRRPRRSYDRRDKRKDKDKDKDKDKAPLEGLDASSCQRPRGTILSPLLKHAAQLTVCVNEMRKSQPGVSMPDRLNIEFVVRPDGKVSNFAVLDRHYRTGLLKNCMTKVFIRVRYPAAEGSNCPVELPLTLPKS
ncbi:hypothetical protein ACFL6C_10955 [Myxococcota bacterium]